MAGEFLNLIQEGQREHVQTMLIRVVKKSFEDDKSRQTQAEVRRRITLCLDGFKMLRGDAKYRWSVDRIVNELPRLLRCRLDGAAYEPDTRSIWIPEDGLA